MDVTRKKQPAAAFTRVGSTRFHFQRVTSQRLGFVAETTCLRCGAAITVPYGAIAATFKVGQEFVGISCDDCLEPASRARLTALREKAAC